MNNSEPSFIKTRPNFAFAKLVVSWVVAIAVAVALQQFAFRPYQVFGKSMEPTLNDGDYLIISKLGATWSHLRGQNYVPDRGDIIVLTADGTRLIKRVIGLPGETVVVKDGKLTIFSADNPNGFNPYIETPNISVPKAYISGEVRTQIPEGQIFVVGDNREGNNSSDSRNRIGTVPTEDIIGVLKLRLLPPTEARTF